MNIMIHKYLANLDSILSSSSAADAFMSSRNPLSILEEEIHHSEIAAAARNNGTDPDAAAASPVIDKSLFSIANLVKLLPTTTALAFQILSPTFTNHGSCHLANYYLTGFLLFFCSIFCVVSTFTDSLVGTDGKLYFGFVMPRGVYVLNYKGEEGDERRRVLGDLKRFRLWWLDGVHAVFGLVVFLSVAFRDNRVQTCFFPEAGVNVSQLLVNLPLGAVLASALVFMIFPSSRKGIGYTATPIN